MRKIFKEVISGRELSVEIGEIARQANGSALIRFDDTVVLVTATAADKPNEGQNFFPLTVDVEERMYAIGKIPGGWLRREGRPSEQAILNCRIIDRSLRPLFPDGYLNNLQIVATVLSVDQDNTPEVVSLLGASLALGLSDIPFNEIVGSVIIGRVNGEFVVNPTVKQEEVSDMHVFVAATEDAIVMIESDASEAMEDDMLEAIEIAHEQIKEVIAFQKRIIEEFGAEKKPAPEIHINDELKDDVRALAEGKMYDVMKQIDKEVRNEALDNLLSDIKSQLEDKYLEYENFESDVKDFFNEYSKEVMRSIIVNEHHRIDGRGLKDIREINTRTGLLPRTHGSALFTRGLTQSLSITTLGTIRDSQRLDDIGTTETKRYMHHYNFPPFATGEAGFMRGPKRREIGHGALAEKAILPVLPSEEDFPYSIRVVSEILESNGSSSMASVCGSSLSLMDAGVPIKRPVAGIALGLIKTDEEVTILSDIQGIEDFYGDMDFKVAGTEKGITAIQLDVKIKGLKINTIKEVLQRAKEGRLHILEIMNNDLSVPREDLSKYAPRMYTTVIPVDKIKVLIGTGGKTINKIIDETGVEIDIQDDGKVYVAATEKESGEKAIKMIEEIIKDVEVGEVYDGKVIRVEKYGAFVELLPGKDGLLHISEMDIGRVKKTEDVADLGDIIKVKVTGIENGKVRLSRKVLLLEEKEKEE
jgi:polyribonucleotide nucleotidyltransferase